MAESFTMRCDSDRHVSGYHVPTVSIKTPLVRNSALFARTGIHVKNPSRAETEAQQANSTHPNVDNVGTNRGFKTCVKLWSPSPRSPKLLCVPIRRVPEGAKPKLWHALLLVHRTAPPATSPGFGEETNIERSRFTASTR